MLRLTEFVLNVKEMAKKTDAARVLVDILLGSPKGWAGETSGARGGTAKIRQTIGERL